MRRLTSVRADAAHSTVADPRWMLLHIWGRVECVGLVSACVRAWAVGERGHAVLCAPHHKWLIAANGMPIVTVTVTVKTAPSGSRTRRQATSRLSSNVTSRPHLTHTAALAMFCSIGRQRRRNSLERRGKKNSYLHPRCITCARVRTHWKFLHRLLKLTSFF